MKRVAKHFCWFFGHKWAYHSLKGLRTCMRCQKMEKIVKSHKSEKEYIWQEHIS